MRKNSKKIYLIPVIYSLVIVVIFGTMMFMSTNLELKNKEQMDEADKVIEIIDPDYVPVVSEVVKKTIKPYNNETVKISVDYYSKDDAAETQEKSLIYFNNKYMQNTGIMYGSTEEFEVLSMYDGVISSINEDEIFQTVIEIKHNEEYSSYYYGVKDTELKIGDEIKTGDIIGKSGEKVFESEQNYNLLVEVYHTGKLIDPETFFDKEIEN